MGSRQGWGGTDEGRFESSVRDVVSVVTYCGATSESKWQVHVGAWSSGEGSALNCDSENPVWEWMGCSAA